jgi:hypothetical protein
MPRVIKRLALWVLRRELASARQEAAQWKQSALIQERYRQEVHGEKPSHEGWRAWFLSTYPTREAMPQPRFMSPILDDGEEGRDPW